MIKYKDFSPSPNDCKGLGLTDQQNWLVLEVFRNRDSQCLEESNFAVALDILGGESETVQVHRFGHWTNGWFELLLIDPNSEAYTQALEIESKLEDYPLLDEDDVSDRQYEAAQETWKNCYSDRQRLEYVRKNYEQFEFDCFSDMLNCVRGKFFGGYFSELIGE
jgi:hypothetical protein